MRATDSARRTGRAVDVRAPSHAPLDTRASRPSAEAAAHVKLAASLRALPPTQRSVAQAKVAAYFVANPGQLDAALSTSSATQRQVLAEATLPGFVRQAGKDPAFATHQNYGRLLKLMEAMDPKLATAELARQLRRVHYPDATLRLAKLDMGSKPTYQSDKLEAALAGSGFKENWQEVVGPTGQRLDVAHSLVALDARLNHPGALGKLRSWVFTDFGDRASELASRLGFTRLGNMNPSDQRGNDFGDRLAENQGKHRHARLSALMEQSFAAKA